MAFTVSGTAGLTFPDATTQTSGVSSPATVAQGGTGNASATAYAVQCGGTTSTGALQSIASVGTSGQVLTSNGAGALPTFQTVNAFAAGTVMLFVQTAAPTGWTKLTTSNDVALRVVSGTASSGGSVAFSTAFASQNVGSTTLSTAQIPAHTHSANFQSPPLLAGGACGSLGSASANTGSTGGGGSHTHTLNIAVSYIDVIQASKN